MPIYLRSRTYLFLTAPPILKLLPSIFSFSISTNRSISILTPRSARHPRRSLMSIAPAIATEGSTVPHTGAPTVLVTNDDGIDPLKTPCIAVAKSLAELGHDVTILAPGRNNSACGQSVTLHKPMTLRRHPAYEKSYAPDGGALRIFSILEGTPADCTAAAIEPGTGLLAKLGLFPKLVVSGINLGANLGTDTIYSGTVGGARQGALYGIPSVACSLCEFSNAPELVHTSIRATCQFVDKVLANLSDIPPTGRFGDNSNTNTKNIPNGGGSSGVKSAKAAFLAGDIMINMNVPGNWNGTFATTTLDQVLYRDILRFDHVPEDETGVKFVFKGDVERDSRIGSDSAAVKEGSASISVVQTFPWSSPRWVPESVMKEAGVAGADGMPDWLSGEQDSVK